METFFYSNPFSFVLEPGNSIILALPDTMSNEDSFPNLWKVLKDGKRRNKHKTAHLKTDTLLI
jgi:hypothetical protein